MTNLWILSVAGQSVALLLLAARRRIPPLPIARSPGEALPPVVLVKPVLDADADTLERCASWLRSAEAYPGRCAAVFAATHHSAEPLRRLREEHPGLEIRVFRHEGNGRERPPTADKTERLAASEPHVDEILAGDDGILIFSDADTSARDPACVERLAAAVKQPGEAASVLYPVRQRSPVTWWQRLATIDMRFNNAIYAVGAAWFRPFHAMMLGWTMVLWRSDLRRAGGFDSASTTLADDVALGVALADQGAKARLFDAAHTIDISESNRSLRDLWAQQIRLHAQLRSCRWPIPIVTTLLLPLCLPVIAAALAFLLNPGFGEIVLLAAAIGISCRFLSIPVTSAWIVPLREIALVAWQLGGMTARNVGWHGFRYRIDARSRIRSRERLVPGSPPESGAIASGGNPQDDARAARNVLHVD